MDLSRYTDLFHAEAREHIGSVNRLLLFLEGQPEDGAAIDEVFRSVHTIKGMASTMGYAVTTELAHGLEHLLAKLRAGTMRVDTEVVDLLLEGIDAVEKAIEREGASTATALSESDARAAGSTPTPGAAGEEGETGEASTAESDVASGDRAPGGPREGAGVVRIRQERLDAVLDHLGELVVARDRLLRASAPTSRTELADAVEGVSRLVTELQDEVMRLRMVPVGEVFDRFPRMVRDAARTLEKRVELEVRGRDQELDRSLLNEVADVLVHLLRNAVDHGIEPPDDRLAAGKPEAGLVRLSAARERSGLVIRVEDDGRGIGRARVVRTAVERGLIAEEERDGLTDAEILDLLTRPGFSTAERVTDVSGRGVGLDAVQVRMQHLGGSLEVTSVEGGGTLCTLRLPLTLAIVRTLLFGVRGCSYVVPLSAVAEVSETGSRWIRRKPDGEWIDSRGELLPLVRLGPLLHPEAGGADPDPMPLLIVEAAAHRFAIGVDLLAGQQDAVLKRFDPTGSTLDLFSAATLLSDGRPALVVDVARIAAHLRRSTTADAA